MRRGFIVIFFLFLFIFFSLSDEKTEKIIFKYGLFVKNEKNIEMSYDFKGYLKLTFGDFFKIYIEPISNVYIYLYLLDSDGNLLLIFPENFDFFKNDYKMSKVFLEPDDNEWFSLDEKSGEEEFHLIASKERQTNLENLTIKYQESIDKKKKNDEIEKLKISIIEEITNIKKLNSPNTVFAEKPSALSGTTKGVKKDKYVQEIITDNTYVKTFKIQH
ncbi:MAG TPA: DUF4384 domain-containing protein [Spirochaetota bacterium]|nr:DUF4384 domain-containing protein [Spirochaetota bacterium]